VRKLKITPGEWVWVGWWLQTSRDDPYAEIIELAHDGDDPTEADKLAIARIPKMLEFIAEIADDPSLRGLHNSANKLLDGLVEEE